LDSGLLAGMDMTTRQRLHPRIDYSVRRRLRHSGPGLPAAASLSVWFLGLGLISVWCYRSAGRAAKAAALASADWVMLLSSPPNGRSCGDSAGSALADRHRTSRAPAASCPPRWRRPRMVGIRNAAGQRQNCAKSRSLHGICSADSDLTAVHSAVRPLWFAAILRGGVFEMRPRSSTRFDRSIERR